MKKVGVTAVHALPTLFTWDAQRGRDEEMSSRKRVRRQMDALSNAAGE